MKKIVFDVMSGEADKIEALNAAVNFAQKNPKSEIILVGSKEEFARIKQYPSNIEFLYSTDVITMLDTSALTFRSKKESSLSIAINQLKDNPEVGAILSCANTGAYITGVFLTSKPVEKNIRPALAGIVKTESKRNKVILDLGAVIDGDASTLEQFAIMGGIYYTILTDRANPKVSLLSNGTEVHKGNAVTKEAFKLLSANPLINFVGNEEGKTLLQDDISDVVVADGFTGNIALKIFQGAMKYVGYNIKESFTKNIFRKIAAAFAYPALNETKTTMSAVEKAGGAVMLGLNHVAIKSPGASTEEAMFNALTLAQKLLDENIVKKIKGKLL